MIDERELTSAESAELAVALDSLAHSANKLVAAIKAAREDGSPAFDRLRCAYFETRSAYYYKVEKIIGDDFNVGESASGRQEREARELKQQAQREAEDIRQLTKELAVDEMIAKRLMDANISSAVVVSILGPDRIMDQVEGMDEETAIAICDHAWQAIIEEAKAGAVQ